jgi:hypothetical protein
MRIIMRNIFKVLMAGLMVIPAGCTSNKVEAIQEPPVEVKQLELGTNLTPNERVVLKFFYDRGITDRMALAVLMGNVKQESKFTPDICEGGDRVGYDSCHSGGFGLIQWTTSGRYLGLGRHADRSGGDPSTLKTQLEYLVTEVEWLQIEHKFKTHGKPMNYYMNAAFYWLGWGVHGERTNHSHYYYANLGDLPK